MSEIWQQLETPGPESALIDGVEVRRGSRVRLRPRTRRDIWDTALTGKVGVVESIEHDTDGEVQLVVTAEDDPGRDLGLQRIPGHRFFFTADEVVPLQEMRILVAGIGNVFLGDDGFGCEVARRLSAPELPPGTEVGDFGIRGMDLAYALRDYDAAVLIDAAPRGEPAGTLSLIEPVIDPDELAIETHGMNPVHVLRLAQELGGVPGRVLVVACEPARIPDPDDGDEIEMGLSPTVAAAVDEAVRMTLDVVEQLAKEQWKGGEAQ